MALPLYEMLINDDLESKLEVNAVAAVDIPAIQATWMAFKDQPNPMAFAATNDEEQVVFGPAMIPNMKIYRRDEDTGEEFEVYFSPETIKAIAVKFFEKNFQTSFNIMHDPSQKKDGVVFFMSVIRDKSKGIVGLEGDYADGTWFLGAKVKNPEVWQKVKSGDIKGFSVEGLFGYKKKENYTADEVFKKICDILSATE